MNWPGGANRIIAEASGFHYLDGREFIDPFLFLRFTLPATHILLIKPGFYGNAMTILFL
jgi:hypothetical protein